MKEFVFNYSGRYNTNESNDVFKNKQLLVFAD